MLILLHLKIACILRWFNVTYKFFDDKDMLHIVWGIVWFNLELIRKFFMGFNNTFTNLNTTHGNFIK